MMVTFLIAAIALVVAVIGCVLVAPSDQGLEQFKTVIYPPR
jgi:preprotein translocase subunit SecG